MDGLARTAFAVSLIGCAVLAAGSARAQEPPNLVGTWKGEAYAVHIGSNPYRVAERNGPNFPGNAVEFTYTITEQHGNRFAGTSTNGKFTETVIGAISLDNRGGVMSDDDGFYTFTLRDLDTMDLCYQHSFQTSRVAACWAVKRAAR